VATRGVDGAEKEGMERSAAADGLALVGVEILNALCRLLSGEVVGAEFRKEREESFMSRESPGRERGGGGLRQGISNREVSSPNRENRPFSFNLLKYFSPTAGSINLRDLTSWYCSGISISACNANPICQRERES
jgi:hypothetical protein